MRQGHYQAIRLIGWGLLQLVVASGLFLSVNHNILAAMPRSLAVELEQLGLPATAISLYAHRLGDEQPVLAHLADRPRNPASTMKLVTTALIKNLRQRGLRHITGDVILDSSLFDRSAINTKPLDHKRYRAYNTPPDALLVNFRSTRLEVFPEGQSLRVYADPPATTLRLENHIKVLTGRCQGRTGGITLTVERQASGTLAKLGGRYPVTCGPTGFNRVLLTQDAYVYGVFRHLWLASGGTLLGTWRSGVAPTNQRAFASHRSDPLANTVHNINKFSNNVMARNLLLTLAAKSPQGTATPSAGRAAVSAWLTQAGIRMPHLAMDNGAGLSRKARLSARGLGQLLLHAWHGPWGPEFISSLPLAGMDGSLRHRFRGLAPGGRIRLKTGRLNGVRAMAGYITLSKSRTHAVVILINQEKLSNHIGDAAPAAVLRWLLRPR